MINDPFQKGNFEKQLMLLKVSSALANRPDFGPRYITSPDDPARIWISRMSAVARKMGPMRQIEFDRALRLQRTHWRSAIGNVLVVVSEIFEELKLELEISEDTELGNVYEAGEEFSFNRDLLSIIDEATSEVFVIDPYFDAPTFTLLFENNIDFQIRVLGGTNVSAVRMIAEKLEKSGVNKIEVRSSKKIHDRVVIVDVEEVWIMGASIKDAGKKPTYLLPLLPELAKRKIAIYEEYWESADKKQ